MIPENNFSADIAVPQVHMINNIVSETCHRLAFLIASDSSTCTKFLRWHQRRRRDSSLRKTDEGNSASSICLRWRFRRRASSTSSWTRRGAVEDCPSGRSMGFFLFTINTLLVWRDRKKRKKRIVPAAILILKYWDSIKSIYISLILTYRSSVNIDIINIDPK